MILHGAWGAYLYLMALCAVFASVSGLLMMKLRFSLRKSAAIVAPCAAVCLTLVALCIYWHVNCGLAFVGFYVLPMLAVFQFLSAYRDARFLFTYCLTVTFGVHMLAALLIVFKSHHWSVVAMDVILTVIFAVMTAVVLWLRDKYLHIQESIHDGWGWMTALLAFFTLICLFSCCMPCWIIWRPDYYTECATVIFITLAAQYVLLHAVFSMERTMAMEQEKRRLELAMRAQQSEKEFYYACAYTDALTGIGNRRACAERLSQLQQDTAARENVMLWVLDADDLKEVNDTQGHQAGDVLLLNVVQSVASLAAEGKSLYRVGGDEFLVIFEGCSREKSRAYIQQWQTLVRAINERTGVRTSASLGIAFGDEAEELLEVWKLADVRMYESKLEYRRLREQRCKA